MADRLQELLQQRALIKEHLEWLDAEIAASSGRVEVSPRVAHVQAPAPAPISSRELVKLQPIPAAAPTATPRPPDEADALLAQLAAEEKAPIPTKRGCWILFLATLAVLCAGAGIFIYFYYRG